MFEALAIFGGFVILFLAVVGATVIGMLIRG